MVDIWEQIRWQRYGADALRLVSIQGEDAELDRRAVQLLERFAEQMALGIIEVTSTARVCLVEFGLPLSEERIQAFSDLCRSSFLQLVEGDAQHPRTSELLIVPVDYSGEDLNEVAKIVGIDAAEVVRRHSCPEYVVEAIGFAPGFPYLKGLDERLRIPRRSVPRANVPAGAVAIGGPYAGIYPQQTPGGWHLLGSTSVRLFLPQTPGICRLRVGDRVKFHPVES